MIFRSALIAGVLACVIRGAATAQPEPPDVNQWLDGCNIRHHVHSESAGLFGFTGVYGDQTTMVWDKKARRYRSTIAEVLHYPAITRTPFRTVSVRHIGPPGYHLQWRFDRMSAVQIAGRMDTIVAKERLQNRIVLRYDDEGRLIAKTSWQDESDSSFVHDNSTTGRAFRRFADSFSYSCTTEGYAAVDWLHTSGYEVMKMSKWDSVNYLHKSECCGTIRTLPYVDRRETMRRWELDDNSLIVRFKTGSAAWVNDCHYEPCDKTLQATSNGTSQYRYDSFGRLLTQVWVQPGRPDVLLKKHVYSDKAPDDRYGPMRVPLMRQYLDRIRNPIMTTDDVYEYSYDAKAMAGNRPDTGKPSIYHTTYITVSDAGGQRLRFDAEKWDEQGVGVYIRSEDSLGMYRIAVRLYGISKNTDDAVYDPRRWRESHTLSGGDYVPTIYELPRGSFSTDWIHFGDRVVARPENGWQMICYGADNMGIYYSSFGAPLDFWAPQETGRYQNAAEIRENFVLLDAQGLVRYVYNDGHVYQLTYE